MKTYNIYGSKTLSLEGLRERVETALGIKFERRDSYHLGGGYFRSGEVGGEEIIIQPNHVLYHEGPDIIEPSYPDVAVLLRVDRTERAEELDRRLKDIAGLTLLRRET